MASNPRVSVLMPLYAPEPRYLRSAIQSVLQQTLEDFELLIVEDPSSPAAEHPSGQYADPRIRYFLNARRGSLVESLNYGLQLARADLVARLDGDDLCAPTRLQRQLEYLQRHAEVSVLGSQITIIDRHGRQRGRRRYPLTHEAILRALPRFNPLAHPSVMYRKAPILDAGGYTYPVNEDYELLVAPGAPRSALRQPSRIAARVPRPPVGIESRPASRDPSGHLGDQAPLLAGSHGHPRPRSNARGTALALATAAGRCRPLRGNALPPSVASRSAPTPLRTAATRRPTRSRQSCPHCFHPAAEPSRRTPHPPPGQGQPRRPDRSP